MKVSERELRRYFRQIRGWLPCGVRLKRDIMQQIRGRTRDFLSDHPDASWEELRAEFGTPQQIAAACVDNTDSGELLRSLRVRRKVVAVAAAAAAVILISWAAVVTWTVYKFEHYEPIKYIEMGIVDVPSEGGNKL